MPNERIFRDNGEPARLVKARARVVSFRSVARPLALSVAPLWAMVAACSSSNASVFAASEPTLVSSGSSGGDNPPQASSGSSGAAAVAGAIVGSPLCNATALSCLPDDPHTSTAQACSSAPDGGPYERDASYADWPLACHVTVGDGGAPETVCLSSGPDQDGASCARGTDCAAGSECVGASGTCRHYCCTGDDRCSSDEFCDIQPIAALVPVTQVPVCMPLRPCGLLDEHSDAGACPSAETCAVARLNGATSCVPTGNAGVHQSCVTEHCQRNLTCVGGLCYSLCHVADPVECPSGETCTGGLPVFVDPAVGICQPDADAN